MTNEPTIDLATFRELQQTAGTEFVAELVETFLEEAPLLLDQLRDSLAAGEADVFRRAAHSLKSNAVTFGAMKLGAMARELELNGIEQMPAEGPPALDALAQEYAGVAAALAEVRNA